MTFTYDVSTIAGQVRLLIPDTRSDAYLFEDAEIDGFLAIEGNDLKLAAALALETAASNEALTLKVIWLMDLKTDGAKVSDSLLKRAALLRSQSEAALNADETGNIDYAEWVVDDASYAAVRHNSWLRSGV